MCDPFVRYCSSVYSYVISGHEQGQEYTRTNMQINYYWFRRFLHTWLPDFPPATVSQFQNEFRVETKMFVFCFSRKLLALLYENEENFRELVTNM
jgi:hypothetical protein